ncbi:hypothetical protein ACIRQQ_38970 [Streptomyces fuscichromogenes]|uniref:hypothetical protein n=1 Tax=Streptomyces fuscichromogenes TaxID=1324013 RepID=UPI00381D13EC
MSTALPATPPPDPSAQDADNDSRHAVHVRVGRHFELKLYLSPTVLAALLGGGTTTAALVTALAR